MGKVNPIVDWSRYILYKASDKVRDAHPTWLNFTLTPNISDYVQNKVIAENPSQQPTKHVNEERGNLFIAKSGLDSQKVQREKIARDVLLNALEVIGKS